MKRSLCMVLVVTALLAADRAAAQETDSFNQCKSPDLLQEQAVYFAPGVELRHDIGGATWTRRELLAHTETYACGSYRRELVRAACGSSR